MWSHCHHQNHNKLKLVKCTILQSFYSKYLRTPPPPPKKKGGVLAPQFLSKSTLILLYMDILYWPTLYVNAYPWLSQFCLFLAAQQSALLCQQFFLPRKWWKMLLMSTIQRDYTKQCDSGSLTVVLLVYLCSFIYSFNSHGTLFCRGSHHQTRHHRKTFHTFLLKSWLINSYSSEIWVWEFGYTVCIIWSTATDTTHLDHLKDYSSSSSGWDLSNHTLGRLHNWSDVKK